jgi:hypothetical protein
MKSTTIESTILLITEECIHCGTVFAMTETLINELRYTGNKFYCPNGHSMVYGGKKAKLERRIKELENDRDWYRNETENQKRALATTRGQLTKIKKRVANGVCPCCHRSFVQLARHMKTKHPDYAETDDRE